MNLPQHDCMLILRRGHDVLFAAINRVLSNLPEKPSTVSDKCMSSYISQERKEGKEK